MARGAFTGLILLSELKTGTHLHVHAIINPADNLPFHLFTFSIFQVSNYHYHSFH